MPRPATGLQALRAICTRHLAGRGRPVSQWGMSRPLATLLCALLLAAAVLVATRPSAWSALWLLAASTGAWAWYRAQARSTEQFFGGLEEDTRLTSLQAPAPGEAANAPAPPGAGSSRHDAH